jgi:hypothetical protein
MPLSKLITPLDGLSSLACPLIAFARGAAKPFNFRRVRLLGQVRALFAVLTKPFSDIVEAADDDFFEALTLGAREPERYPVEHAEDHWRLFWQIAWTKRPDAPLEATRRDLTPAPRDGANAYPIHIKKIGSESALSVLSPTGAISMSTTNLTPLWRGAIASLSRGSKANMQGRFSAPLFAFGTFSTTGDISTNGPFGISIQTGRHH